MLIHRFFLLFALFFSASGGFAACTITPLQVRLCDVNGNPGQSKVGDPLYVRIDWRVVGTANQNYKVRFRIAGLESTVNVNSTAAGDRWAFAGWNIMPDGAVPCEVLLDSENVTGDTTPADNLSTINFTQTPPAVPLEYYAPRRMLASQTLMANWIAGSGSIVNGLFWLGTPTSETYQTVIDTPGPANAEKIVVAPFSRPIWQTQIGTFNPLAGNLSRSTQQTLLVRNQSVRVNPNLLKNVTWSRLTDLPSDVSQWLSADESSQSTNATVIDFVNGALPANYKTTLSPYETARLLFLAVVKRLSYVLPAPDNRTANDILVKNQGDCVSFTCLYVSALRSVGIPARAVVGWWDESLSRTPGVDAFHVLTEFYLPTAGWVPADGAASDGIDPTGKTAFFFGTYPSLNNFVAVSRGSSHQQGTYNTTYIQSGAWFYMGTAIAGAGQRTAVARAYTPPNPFGTLQNIAFGTDGRLHLLYTTAGRASLGFLDSAGAIEYMTNSDVIGGVSAIGFTVGKDNSPKLLWKTATNAAGYWSLNSLYEYLRTPGLGPFTDFQPVNVSADTNTDTTRLLWRRTDGAAAVWNLDKNDGLAAFRFIDAMPNWEPMKAVAMSGGKTRLLWRNKLDGSVQIWRLNADLSFDTMYSFKPPAGWNPLTIAIGKDDKIRLVWKHIDARVVLFNLTQSGVFESGVEYPFSPGWTFQDVAVGPDGKVRLVWKFTSGLSQIWTLKTDTSGIETIWWYSGF